MRKRSLAAVAALLVFGGLCSRLFADIDRWPTVWDGIYSSSQAARGEGAYRTYCASCHGMKLEGDGRVPPLAGRDFRWDWDFMGVDSLFEKMLYTMPLDNKGDLNPVQEADILAYILQSNQYPAGSRDLPADADLLRVVRFEADKSLH